MQTETMQTETLDQTFEQLLDHVFNPPASGQRVRVFEVNAERRQVVTRAAGRTAPISGSRRSSGGAADPNPYELVSAALGACTTMSIRRYADRKGIPLERVEISVSHLRASTQARDSFVRTIFLDGDLSEAQRSQLVQIAAHCPIGKMLSAGAEIHTVLSTRDPDTSPMPEDMRAIERRASAHRAADLNAAWLRTQ